MANGSTGAAQGPAVGAPTPAPRFITSVWSVGPSQRGVQLPFMACPGIQGLLKSPAPQVWPSSRTSTVPFTHNDVQ